MDLEGIVAIVAGGGSGIGAALVDALVEAGAAHVVVADIALAGAQAVAARHGGRASAQACDVGDEAAVTALVDGTVGAHGSLGLVCSNAGIGRMGALDQPLDDWQASWVVNVLSHRHAAVAALPHFIAAGGGHLLQTVSAAGLLCDLGSPSYTATKHAALAFAEWVSISHAKDGVGVTALCPQFVQTPLLEASKDVPGPGWKMADQGVVLTPEAVAAVALEAVREGRFLALPHPEVATYEQRRAGDRERWLGGMRKLVV